MSSNQEANLVTAKTLVPYSQTVAGSGDVDPERWKQVVLAA